MITEKLCNGCGKVKKREEFSSHKTNHADGLQTKCKECDKAYQAQWRKTHPRKRYNPIAVDPQAKKLCKACQQEKTYASFGKSWSRKDGYEAECNVCLRKRKKEHKRKVTPEQQERYREQKTPIDIATYRKVHAQQQGKCAICGKPETARNQHRVQRLAVDHCHVTGQFRGLLCHNCNLGLGYFKDDPDLLQKAIVYLSRNVVTERVY